MGRCTARLHAACKIAVERGEGDGDGDEPTGLLGCCICLSDVPFCEVAVAPNPATTEAECEAYGEAYESGWEWWDNCYEDDVEGLVCPGSCAD